MWRHSLVDGGGVNILENLLLQLQGKRSNLKTEAAGPSKKLVASNQIMGWHIFKDNNINTQCQENTFSKAWQNQK